MNSDKRTNTFFDYPTNNSQINTLLNCPTNMDVDNNLSISLFLNMLISSNLYINYINRDTLTNNLNNYTINKALIII